MGRRTLVGLAMLAASFSGGCHACEKKVAPPPPPPSIRVDFQQPDSSAMTWRGKIYWRAAVMIGSGFPTSLIQYTLDGTVVAEEELAWPGEPGSVAVDTTDRFYWEFQVRRELDTSLYTDGDHRLAVSVENGPTSRRSEDWAVRFDNTPPKLEIKEFPEPEATATGFWLAAGATDASGPVSGIDLEINGITIRTIKELPFRIRLAFPDLREGEHQFSVAATDAVGNVARRSVALRK